MLTRKNFLLLALATMTFAYADGTSALKCPVEDISPSPICAFGDHSSNDLLKLAPGCHPDNENLITKSVVGVYYPNKFSTTPPGHLGLSCTGIPIGDGTWVITAGHCMSGNDFTFYGQNASKWRVMAGKAQLPSDDIAPDDSEAIQLSAIYVLSNRGDGTKCQDVTGKSVCEYQDIALLKLKNYKFKNPIPLIDHTLNRLDQLWIAGYGKNEQQQRTGILTYRDSYYWDNLNPQTKQNYGEIISVGSIPKYYKQPGDNPKLPYMNVGCAWKFDGNGDSGGPLFSYENGQLYLVSVLTGGAYADGNTNQHLLMPDALISNASIYYYRDKILGIMDGTLNPSEYKVSMSDETVSSR